MASTAPHQFTDADRSAKAAVNRAAEMIAVNVFERAASDYAAAYRRSDGIHTPSVIRSLLALCNAAHGIVDDGDFAAQRDSIMEEYRWDRDGNPLALNAYGDVLSECGL